MSEAEIRTLVIEREFPHPPEKIWRALTQGPLIEEWLLKNDFHPAVGHRFSLQQTPMPQWDGVIDCEVLVVEPNKTLAYTWNALGLKSIVTFTLTPTPRGALLRMEQSGFRPGEERNYQGAKFGWQRFLGNLEQTLARIDFNR